MSNNDPTVMPFAGLTRHDDAGNDIIPDGVWGHHSSMRWWAADRTGEEEPTELPGDGFNSVLMDLPRANEARVGWQHPLTGEFVPTEKHNALIEPGRAENLIRVPAGSKAGRYLGTQEQIDEYVNNCETEELKGLAEELGLDWEEVGRAELREAMVPGDDALFHIPTDNYEIINPVQALRPLASVLQEEGLGDKIFGEIRIARAGGRVNADLFMDGKHVQYPGYDGDAQEGDAVADGGANKPIVVGLEFGYDFFGDQSFRARGVALRTSCMNSMRGITDWQVVKHSGDVEGRVAWEGWWSDLLEEIDLKTDQLSAIIHEATEMDLDLSEMPDDFADILDADSSLEALYRALGYPEYLAQEAAANCRAEAQDAFKPTWWDIYNGATWALTHAARGDRLAGGAIDQYARIANDALMNPAANEERVAGAYEQARDKREDATLEGEGGGTATIADAFASVRSKKEHYEQQQTEIRRLVAAERGD